MFILSTYSDLKCCVCCPTTEVFSYFTIYSFSLFFPLWLSKRLLNMDSLVLCFHSIYNSLYDLNSQSTLTLLHNEVCFCICLSEISVS